jgi:hypothetical protein
MEGGMEVAWYCVFGNSGVKPRGFITRITIRFEAPTLSGGSVEPICSITKDTTQDLRILL